MNELERDILNLFKKCDLENLSESNFEEHVLAVLPDDNYKWMFGASKLVLFFSDFPDFVVKIPFAGTHMRRKQALDTGAWNEENYIFFPFEGAPYCEDSWDYCESETILYESAKKFKVEEFFLETKFVGRSYGYPIYKQEKGISFSDSDRFSAAITVEECSKAREMCSKSRIAQLPAKWVRDAIECYGEKRVKELLDFIHEKDLDDLHDDNLGYYNNKPIILDYSNFSS